MELKKLTSHIKVMADKYKYVILVLVIGILLMWLPEGKDTAIIEAETVTKEMTTPDDVALSDILSLIDGAGTVKVMLTKAKGEETVYQEDLDKSSDGSREDMRSDTVIVSDSERREAGLVKQINPPIYMGAIVVCEGADDPTVKFAIVDAVAKITGLGADKICVLKMK